MYTRDRPMRRLPRMTRNQALVLELLRRESRAMTAYQILEALRGQGFRQPVQVYRALDSLMAREQVHRIESLNAFVACRHDTHHYLSGFAICDDCRTVWGFTVPEGVELMALADSKGFQTHDVMVELHGLCKECRPARTWQERDERLKRLLRDEP